MRNHLLLLISCCYKRTAVRLFKLASSTQPILAIITFEMMANKVVVIIVGITVAADEWTIIALEFAVDCALV